MRIKKRFSQIPLFFLIMIFFFLLNWGGSQEQAEAEKKKKEPLSKWSKQWLEEVVPYIITNIEKSVFINLPNEIERGKFIEKFWERKDPDPQTPENEFKIAYYKRIAIANKFFGTSGIEGWRTDRGKIFLLLGPPNEIQRDLNPSETGFSSFHGPKEIWNYWGLRNPRLPYNLEFIFVDEYGTGNHVLESSLTLREQGRENFDISSIRYHFDQMEILAEVMKNPFESEKELQEIITSQVTYNLIPLKYDLFCLKGTEKKTYIPVVIEIPYSKLSNKKIEDRYYYSLTLMLNLRNKLGQTLFQKSRDINFNHSPTELPSLENEIHKIQTVLFLEPGDYKIHLLVLDNFSGKIGNSQQDISVRKFGKDGLALSDIILSRGKSEAMGKKPEIEEGTLFKREIFLDISKIFKSGEELNIYFEIYNLSLKRETGLKNFKVEYFFLRNGKLLVQVPYPKSDQTNQKDRRVQTFLKLRNIKPGEYVLKVNVTDENLRKSASKEIQFQIIQ